ncbi:hypothetical protein FOZ63_013678 [Perkinsus olseni]|uniref:Uncharacterized protein n=1 Tax=Perkinsus olseni TaxID=32597 RepID=A0A7J6TB40_PEROL|nr:hypothetical protein FOZ63_013678 [Perkinsus olseni]
MCAIIFVFTFAVLGASNVCGQTVAPLPQYFRDAVDIQVPETQQTTTTAEPLVDLSSVDISKSMGDFEESLFQQPGSDTSAPSSAETTKPDNNTAGDMKDSPWLPAIFAVAVVNLLLTAAGVLVMMRRTAPQRKAELTSDDDVV